MYSSLPSLSSLSLHDWLWNKRARCQSQCRAELRRQAQAQGLLLVTIPEDSLSKTKWESGPAQNMQGLLPNSYPKVSKDCLVLAFPIMLYTA